MCSSRIDFKLNARCEISVYMYIYIYIYKRVRVGVCFIHERATALSQLTTHLASRARDGRNEDRSRRDGVRSETIFTRRAGEGEGERREKPVH